MAFVKENNNGVDRQDTMLTQCVSTKDGVGKKIIGSRSSLVINGREPDLDYTSLSQIQRVGWFSG